MQITMRKGAALPDRGLVWLDDQGNLINFSAGYTFQLKISATGDGTALVTKTTGITGAATSPNVTISWTVAELASLSAEVEYVCQLAALRTSDGKPRPFPDFTLWLTPTIT